MCLNFTVHISCDVQLEVQLAMLHIAVLLEYSFRSLTVQLVQQLAMGWTIEGPEFE
jgi:hypothetical protein